MANIIQSPGRYVQGAGEIQRIYDYIQPLGKRFFFIVSSSGLKRVEKAIRQSFGDHGEDLVFEIFNGECSKNEIDRLTELYKSHGCDVVIGIGGGKILDTSKALAYYQKAPVVIVPTIASTDAPCSALSVIYTDEGVFEEYLFLPANPNLVLVDTQMVTNAPVRLLVSGMGDALATYFEAKAAIDAGALNCAGGKGTQAALSLARLCYETLLSEGLQAKLAVERKVCTQAVENIIEANTYLSGIGFESGGLAAAHAIHNGLTNLPECHALYHGEKVAFGTLAQLVLENAPMEQIEEVLGFCMSIGLPTTLADLGVTDPDPEALMKVATAAADAGDTAHNMPMEVTAEKIYAAILAADAIGSYAKHDCCC